MAKRRAPTPGAQWGMRVEMQLEEKLAVYNRQKTPVGYLKMINDQVYSGLFRFTYCPSGSNTTKSHNLHVTSEMTCADVVPMLCRHFVPHLNGMVEPGGHISLVQGEMERVLDDSDKPLQIALECSTKGLASPKFLFRPPVDPLTADGSPSHRMRTSGFTSYVGALAPHSTPDIAIAPSSLPISNQSPHLPTQLDRNHWLSTDGEQNSLYSVDSYNSLTNTGSHSALHRMKHMSKSVTALEQKPKSSPQEKRLTHIMLSDSSDPNCSPTSTMQYLQPPNTPSRQPKMTRAKNSVGNFFTRSLRTQKKLKPKEKKSSLYGETTTGSNSSLQLSAMPPEERDATAKLSQLASPLLTERRITMSTVMHVHYRNEKDAFIYKSLLVPQNAKAREVVLEALKRFELTVVDPRDFSLFEVVGRWQDVSQSVENESRLRPGLSLGNISAPKPVITSIEEFIVCYSREIGPNECPYNLKFYYAMQEGYTRRFELREQKHRMPPRHMSRSYQALDMKDTTTNELSVDNTLKRLSWANAEVFCKDGSPLFGATSQRSRRAKRYTQVSSSLSSAVQEGSETEEGILDAVKSKKEHVSNGEEPTSKVILRRGKVKKTHLDSLLVDEVDSFHVENSKIHHRQPLLSATSSSPDSGVVSFSKDKKLRTNSEDLSSTADQHHRLESASVYTDTPTHTASSHSLMQLMKMVFLLNLKLHDSEKELLIQPLEAVTVNIMSSNDGLKSDDVLEESDPTQHICLYHEDLPQDSQPLCSIRLETIQTRSSYEQEHTNVETGKVYVLNMMHADCPVHVNGNLVVDPTPLSHGDLISLYNECYMFLFQDHYNVTLRTSNPYNWRPHPINYPLPSSPLTLGTPLPSSPIVKDMQFKKNRQFSTSLEREDSKPTGEGTPLYLPPHTYYSQASHDTAISINPPSTDLSGGSDTVGMTPTPVKSQRKRLTSDKGTHRNDKKQRPGSSNSLDHRRVNNTRTQNVGYYSLQRQRRSDRCRHHLSSSSSSITSMPSSPARKSLFSFSLNEEADVLRYLVTEFDVSRMSCYLGPALLLAMCTEYCHKCHGPAATSKFTQRTVDSVQEVVWECTKRLTQWKPDPTMSSRPLSHCESLFPLLQPTIFWLANALELHHLLSQSYNLSPSESQSTTQQTKNPITILHDILVYTFQQMFYTVSKVLFYSLPLVLDGCKQQSEMIEEQCENGREGAAEDEIVEQAVDFLQALLDLMTDLQLHLEVVSCFYANLFFFINTTLLNSVMKLGPNRGIFTHSAGTTLRSSLTLLEGWACQVGFKGAVLHHLAKLSSILDILAMPPHQLLQLSWDELRDEFPVLHPSQLHLLLSHYTPPPSFLLPSHWAPTRADMSLAHDTALVSESYDCHPGFTLPQDSYTLSLTKTPPQPKEFQALIDDLHTTLKQNSKSVDVVPIVESAPSAQLPTLLTNLTPTTNTTSRHHNHHHRHHVIRETGARGDIHTRQEGTTQQDNDNDDDDRIHIQTTSETNNNTMIISRSHDNLHTHNLESSSGVGIGSNTESQEDLLDDKNRRNRSDGKQTQMGENSNSGSKVADLINTYEETAKLSQSSSDSVKMTRVESEGRGEVEILGRRKMESGERGDVEIVGRGKIGRVMSMVTEHAFSQPQTLVLKEVNGCHENTIEEWESSSFPDGAHLVNIQRGDKGFGVILVERKDPLTGIPSIYVQQILLGSTADQCKRLKIGDRVLAIDGQLLDGADYLIAEKYLKEAEDDVQLVVAPTPLQIHSQ